jgi:hypothetical protein
MIKNVYCSSGTLSVIPFWFQWNLNFDDSFSKNTQMSSFVKICPVGAELFHANGRRDMTKLTVAFRNLAKTPKICLYPEII